MMGDIVWLASFPKSGNTWFRVFVANLLSGSAGPVGINGLNSVPHACGREEFEGAVGVEASDLAADEIEVLRPYLYDHIAEKAEERLFLKIHDAYAHTSEGRPIVSEKATAGAVYILRNPLDVAVSFAHHVGADFDTVISRMADTELALCSSPASLHSQLRQRLSSWSRHVTSWVDAPGLRVHPMRYEDMHGSSLETFAGAARFCGLTENPGRIREALERSSFDELHRQEREHGFRERSPRAECFFRAGKIGSWRDELTQRQVRRVVEDHGEVMLRFGYLDENGEILC